MHGSLCTWWLSCQQHLGGTPLPLTEGETPATSIRRGYFYLLSSMLWVGLGLKPCDHLLRLSGLVQSTESPVQAKWEARLHETEEHAYSSPRKDQKQIVTGMKQQGSGFRVSGKQTQIWFWRGDSLLDGINNTNMSVIEILPHKEPRMATHHPAFEWGKWCSENYTHTHTHACMHTHTHTHTHLYTCQLLCSFQGSDSPFLLLKIHSEMSQPDLPVTKEKLTKLPWNKEQWQLEYYPKQS